MQMLLRASFVRSKQSSLLRECSRRHLLLSRTLRTTEVVLA